VASDGRANEILGDMWILVELAGDTSVVALAAEIESMVARPLPDRVAVLGTDDDIVDRSLSEGLIPVGLMITQRWRSTPGYVPADFKRLDVARHPYALLQTYNGEYRQLRLRNFARTEVSSIRAGVLFDGDDKPMFVPGLAHVSLDDFRRTEVALQKERAAQRAAEDARLAQWRAEHAAAEVEGERIRAEQAQRSISVEVSRTGDLDKPIEELHHAEVLEIGQVVWEWWVPDGVDSGGPMTREYGDAVVRWSDGEYYYLQMNDHSHELTPLGRYDSDYAATQAGRRHSLYTDDERERLDEEDP
jgi:hypothetical protein